MSIVWVHEMFKKSGSTDASAGKVTYRRYFQVLTDDVADGPQVIQTAEDPSTSLAIPQPFEVYVAGNDEDHNAVAMRIDPRRDDDAPLLWHVVVNYRVVVWPERDPPTPIDATAYIPSVRSWPVAYDEIIWTARLQKIGTDPANPTDSFAAAMATNKVAVTNSLKKFYAEGIVARRHATAWEIKRYEWYYHATSFDTYRDVVNQDVWWGYAIGTVRLVSISGELTTIGSDLIWRVTYELHVKSDGWGTEIADNGMEIWVQSDGSPADSIGNAAKQGLIINGQGQPVSAPVWLDGAGYAGGLSAPVDPNDPPYLVRWHHLEQQIFANLPYPLPNPDPLNILLA